jgi:hypothetical protein
MDTSGSTCPAFSRADRRRLLQTLARAHDARLYRHAGLLPLRAVVETAEGALERAAVHGIRRYCKSSNDFVK